MQFRHQLFIKFYLCIAFYKKHNSLLHDTGSI